MDDMIEALLMEAENQAPLGVLVGDAKRLPVMCRELAKEVRRLDALINNPHTDDFTEGVKLEAAHQVEVWGEAADRGKTPTDWLWLAGYLVGKACMAAINGDAAKAKHHTISTSAAMLNWHKVISAGNEYKAKPDVETILEDAFGQNFAGERDRSERQCPECGAPAGTCYDATNRNRKCWREAK